MIVSPNIRKRRPRQLGGVSERQLIPVDKFLECVHGDQFTNRYHFGQRNFTERDLPFGKNIASKSAMRSLYDETLDRLEQLAKERFKNVKGMADHLGRNANLFTRWFNRDRAPRWDDLAKTFEALGVKVVFPGESQELSREVCWVDAKIVPAGNGQPLPPAESYFAVPLVGEAGAGPGIMATEEIKSWVLVYRHQHAVRLKSNLLAVEIGKTSTSMVPLLRPGDIVLVDREDIKPDRPGGIFLVREPGQEGGAMVKRVAVKENNGDLLVTFYSENAAENPADTFNLRADYDGDISKAIVGRCVWAWSDITGK